MMKRLLAVMMLLLASGVLLAQTIHEIPCSVMADGGGTTASTNLAVLATLGQPVVGRSTAPNHGLQHGYLPCGQTPTGVRDEPPAAPDVFELHQNVPNPFNPQTAIGFDVPAAGGQVRLTIYDLGGRRIRALVDRVESPGRKTVVWNGTDEAGRPVASGLYVYVLETPVGRFAKKMALVR